MRPSFRSGLQGSERPNDRGRQLETDMEGRVAHVGMGHDEKVWCLRPYQRLMLQAIAWLTA